MLPEVPWQDAPFDVPLDTDPCQRLEMLDILMRRPCPELDAASRGISSPVEALRWAQRRGYHPDTPGKEEFQSLKWTIEHGGDCEDLASLVVALMWRLGYDAEVVWITQTGQDLNHVTARVKLDGENWYWADASIDGAILGEDPYKAAERLGKLHVLGGR